MIQKLRKNIVIPLMEWRRGSKSIQYLKELEKSQWLSPEELEKLQNKKLKKIIKYAYETVPYYHKLFDENNIKPEEIKTKKDLVKIPPLTKEIIRENFEDLISKKYPKNLCINYKTSGSTGNPVSFLRTKESFDYSLVANWRFWKWAGWDLGKKYIELAGCPVDVKNINKWYVKLSFFLRGYKWIDAFDLSEENLNKYLKIIEKYKPEFIRGFANPLYLFSLFLTERNIKVRCNAVFPVAEKLFNFQRKKIEESFDCKCFDVYGMRETAVYAGECEQHDGYHIAAENGIYEFIKDGKQIEDGEEGKIYITDFTNFGMPFIRYKIGDLAIPTKEKCKCGRGLPKIKLIEGRIHDFLFTKDGRFIPANFFLLVFINIEKDIAKFFKIIQKKNFDILLKIVPGKDYNLVEKEKLKKVIQEKMGEDIKIEIEEVDSIEKEKSGKFRFITSEIKKEDFLKKNE